MGEWFSKMDIEYKSLKRSTWKHCDVLEDDRFNSTICWKCVCEGNKLPDSDDTAET